jgi:hypothetical protein
MVTMMTDLSPAAQAVYDAYCEQADNPYYYERSGLVAALRAAADQVAPLSTNRRQDDIRQKLLAIAAELEGGDAG